MAAVALAVTSGASAATAGHQDLRGAVGLAGAASEGRHNLCCRGPFSMPYVHKAMPPPPCFRFFRDLFHLPPCNTPREDFRLTLSAGAAVMEAADGGTTAGMTGQTLGAIWRAYVLRRYRRRNNTQHPAVVAMNVGSPHVSSFFWPVGDVPCRIPRVTQFSFLLIFGQWCVRRGSVSSVRFEGNGRGNMMVLRPRSCTEVDERVLRVAARRRSQPFGNRCCHLSKQDTKAERDAGDRGQKRASGRRGTQRPGKSSLEAFDRSHRVVDVELHSRCLVSFPETQFAVGCAPRGI